MGCTGRDWGAPPGIIGIMDWPPGIIGIMG
jgi:hypothetical protein